MVDTRYELNTGALIPALGFGTWQDEHAQTEAVATALRCGYRHIDTASMYGTEKAVGQGIRDSGVPRKDIFLVTKLWNHQHRPEDVEGALDASLKALGTDYVDLWLMHWPVAFKPGDDMFPKDKNDKIITAEIDIVDTWRAMENVFRKGKAKAIGVSNFSKSEMERLLGNCSVPPAVHQFECHPYLVQQKFNDWHKEQGIHVTQYNPFSNANPWYTSHPHARKLLEHPTLQAIGRTHNKTPAQIALAWAVSHGRSVIPKSTTEARIKSNLEGDFILAPGERESIDMLDANLRYLDASDGFQYNFFSDLDDKRGVAKLEDLA